MVLYKAVKKRSKTGRAITYFGILEKTDKTSCFKCGKEARKGSLFRIEKRARCSAGNSVFEPTGRIYCLECADLLDVSGITIQIHSIIKDDGGENKK